MKTEEEQETEDKKEILLSNCGPYVSQYVSKRVFDGRRPLSAAQVAKLRTSYDK